MTEILKPTLDVQKKVKKTLIKNKMNGLNSFQKNKKKQ